MFVPPGRIDTYTTAVPFADRSNDDTDRLGGVIGAASPVIRRVRGSNGSDHSREVSDLVTNASLSPSGATETSPSTPAPVVSRVGPPIQRSVTGSTSTRQRFRTPRDNPSMYSALAAGAHLPFTILTP